VAGQLVAIRVVLSSIVSNGLYDCYILLSSLEASVKKLLSRVTKNVTDLQLSMYE
jgi:hypothetical protein